MNNPRKIIKSVTVEGLTGEAFLMNGKTTTDPGAIRYLIKCEETGRDLETAAAMVPVYSKLNPNKSETIKELNRVLQVGVFDEEDD